MRGPGEPLNLANVPATELFLFRRNASELLRYGRVIPRATFVHPSCNRQSQAFVDRARVAPLRWITIAFGIRPGFLLPARWICHGTFASAGETPGRLWITQRYFAHFACPFVMKHILNIHLIIATALKQYAKYIFLGCARSLFIALDDRRK